MRTTEPSQLVANADKIVDCLKQVCTGEKMHCMATGSKKVKALKGNQTEMMLLLTRTSSLTAMPVCRHWHSLLHSILHERRWHGKLAHG